MRVEEILLAIALAAHTVIGAKCPDRGYVSRKYDGTCIEFIREPSSYSQAKKKCEEHNGHLLTIEDKDKQDWLQKTLEDINWGSTTSVHDRAAVWIGIRRSTSSNTQRQLDDSFWYNDNKRLEPQNDLVPIKFEYWGPGEPDPNKDRDCAIFGYRSEYKWEGSVCNDGLFSYRTACQYDGPDGLISNPAFVVITIVVIAVMFLAGAVLLYYCYIKRKTLSDQLHGEKDKYIFHEEYHVNNTDNDINGDHPNISNNNNTPNHYAPITSNSHHDFNILTDSGHQHDKLQRKDLSLQNVACSIAAGSSSYKPDYSRSVSAPPKSSSPYSKASAPSEDCTIVVEEDEHPHDSTESSPLHLPRVDSIESNNMFI